MKIKIVPAGELTEKNLTASYYIPDAFYTPDRKITFKVRDRNTVLDKDAWPVISITLKEEIVVRLNLLNQGIPRIDFRLGDDFMGVMEWLAQDYTGQHPEHFHEIYNHTTEKWESCYGRGRFVEILASAYRNRPT